MPPRSVCLNVFTTTLGNGKEPTMSVKEVEMGGMEGDQKGKREERPRHDSVQESPDVPLATSSSVFTDATTTTNIITSSSDEQSRNLFSAQMMSDAHTAKSYHLEDSHICNNCAQPRREGIPLQRCSRCKRKYYCSKVCQRHDWKHHKHECEPAGQVSPCNLSTPDISTPGTPIAPSDPMDAQDAYFIPSEATHHPWLMTNESAPTDL